MWRFIFGIIFVIVAIVAFFVRRAANKTVREYEATPRDERTKDQQDNAKAAQEVVDFTFWARNIALVLGVLLVAWSFLRIVPAQNSAVQVRWGNTLAVHDDGPTFALPWDDFNNISLRISTVEHQGVEYPSAIDGRGDDDSSYEVDGVIRYSIPEPAAIRVFDEYGTDRGAFERNVINADFRGQVRLVFSGTPVLDLDSERNQMQTDTCDNLNVLWGNDVVTDEDGNTTTTIGENSIAFCESVVLRNIVVDADIVAQAEAINIAKGQVIEARETALEADILAQIEVTQAAAGSDAQQIFECGYTWGDDPGYEGDGTAPQIRIPNERDEACDEVLTDRGLFIRCLATVAGTVENSQPNQYILPLDCPSLLTGTPTGGFGEADVLLTP